jgi:hypothetical protein
MNQISWQSLIRTFLTVIGTFLIGKHVLGNTIDQQIWETILGAIMTVVSVVWSIIDKTATTEKLQSGVRQVVATIGGLLIASGKLTPEKLETWLGVVAILVPIIQGWLSRKKVAQLQSGEISLLQLKGSKSTMTPRNASTPSSSQASRNPSE